MRGGIAFDNDSGLFPQRHHTRDDESYLVFERVPFEKGEEADAFWIGFRVCTASLTYASVEF
jgi:hypothetical protein